MRIAGAASALPKNKYDQRVLLSALKAHWGERLEDPRFLERLHGRVGVETRYLALPMEDYYGIRTWGEANRHWIAAAEDLGAEALTLALQRTGVGQERLGAIFFVSITGVASPSIEARIMNRLKLHNGIKRIPIFGLGCVAGASGVARAADDRKAYPEQAAAVISVELCSLTLQRDDFSVANLISSGLFGDGAAAVIVTEDGDGPRIVDTRPVFYPDTEQVMGWDISERGFRIVLSREVPEVVEKNLPSDVDAFLAGRGLTRGDIGNWIMHTGGPRILEATERALELPAGALDASWTCLRRTGNLSSASVLLVLEETLMNRRPAAGTYGLMAA